MNVQLINNEDFSCLVHDYNSKIKLGSDSEEVSELRKIIEGQLYLICYYLPQTFMRLDHEDASDFVLFMKDRYFKSIISSYGDAYDDFIAYIYPILQKKLNTFLANQYNQKKEERVSNYSLISDNDDTCGHMIAENHEVDDEITRRFRYAILNYPVQQKQFYVFFMSFAPFMSVDKVENICSICKFNFEQTLALMNKVEEKSKKLLNKYAEISYRRNYYYEKSIENQFEKEIVDSTNKEAVDQLVFQLDRSRKYHKQKIDELESFNMRLSTDDLAQLFKIPKGSVSFYCHVSVQLIKLCLKKANSENFDTGNLPNGMVADLTSKKILSIGRHKMFYPFKEFGINTRS